VISWAAMGYGAALSALLAAVLAAIQRPRQAVVIATTALGAALGPLAWNAILHTAHAPNFFTDAPVALMPASWQDTGSGMFTIAVTSLALGFGPLASQPARRVAVAALLAGLAAFLVDVYLY
jgi:hypothetical protein